MGNLSVLQFQGMTDFQCIQDACENTCCGNWKIPIDHKSLTRFKKKLPEIHNLIASDGGGEIMPLGEDGYCSQLIGKKCGIHMEHGTEMLAEICHEYPRMQSHVNDFEIRYVVPSCPEAARIYFHSDKPFKLLEIQETVEAENKDIIEVGRLKNAHIIEIYEKFTALFSLEDFSATELILLFARLIKKLEKIPMEKWSDAIDDFIKSLDRDEEPHPKFRNIGRLNSILILKEITNTDHAFLNAVRPDLEKSITSAIKRVEKHLQSSSDNQISQTVYMHLTQIDRWLKRHLCLSLITINLPYRSQTTQGKSEGKSPILWAKRIIMEFLVIRFSLLGLLDQKPNTEDTDFIDLLHRIYRVICHIPTSEQQQRFMDLDFDDVVKQLYFVP